MATQGWITVPGKGKRWRDSSGNLTYMPPASAGAGAILSAPMGAALNGAVDFVNRHGIGISEAARAEYLGAPGRSDLNPVELGRYGAPGDQKKFDTSQDPLLRSIDPALDPGPGLGAPTVYGDPAARARESEQRRMMQQYASKEYWDTEAGKAMMALGDQDRYTGKDLGGFYKAQNAIGVGSFDEVLSGLAQTNDRYKEGGDLRKWAEANKTLALREYMKRYPQMQSPDPTQEDVHMAMAKGQFFASEGSPNPLGNQSQLVAGVDPGITMGPLPGTNGALNHEKTAAIQATGSQAAATEGVVTAVNMQPASAAATAGVQPTTSPSPGNIPGQDPRADVLDPRARALMGQYRQMLQGAASQQGGR